MESPDFTTFACTNLYSRRTASKQKVSIPLVWIIENFERNKLEVESELQVESEFESELSEFEDANTICGPEFKFHPLRKDLWKLELNCKHNPYARHGYYTRYTTDLRKVSEGKNTAVQFTIYWYVKNKRQSQFVKQNVTVPANVCHHEIFNSGINDFISIGSVPADMVIQIKTHNNVAQQSANNATCVEKALDFQSSLDKGKVAVLADMESILKESEFTDTVLRSEGNEIRVHRCILAGRSAVFKSMFRHQMSEETSGLVNISDIPYKILELFVSYLYTGRLVDLDMKSASELFVVSDKYAVKDLHETCSLFLKRGMIVENCLEILMLADTHSNENLRSSAMTYFKQHFKKICQKPDWKNVIKARPNMSYELLDVLAST